jgi:hypothetical protein
MKLFNKSAKSNATDPSLIYRLNQPYFLTKNHAKSNVEFKYLNNPGDKTITVAYHSSLLKRRAR